MATLIVAVVGATFAYYSVNQLNSTSQINVKATTDAVGAITLYSPNTELGMTITPTDMAITNAGHKYYALVYHLGSIPSEETPNEANPKETSGVYALTKKNHIMTRAVLVGGNEETAYTCTSKLKVTLDLSDNSMGKVLQQGDAIMYFTTKQTTMKRSGEEDYKTEQELDLYDLTKLGGSTQELVYDLVYKVNGNSAAQKNEANVMADLEINNKQNDDQRYLAGTDGAGATLTVILQSTNFECTIDTEKVAD